MGTIQPEGEEDVKSRTGKKYSRKGTAREGEKIATPMDKEPGLETIS